MISHQKKFIFIHIPKTGGNSIQNILRVHSDDEIVVNGKHQDGVERFELRNTSSTTLHKHSSLRDYRRAFGSKVRSYYIFTTIRNPWDKIVSFYFSPHRGEQEFDPSQFEKFAESVQPIEKYVSNSIWNYLFFNTHHISRLMRFESLSDDFAMACTDLDINPGPLATRNKSRRIPYRECYSTKLAERVRQRHRAEIQLGNYKF